ncbi:MAG: hypothetical protein JNM10_00375 [Planctomycetia bacterium]|nr:hypothetical protein [Planctomycetia bacterium]
MTPDRPDPILRAPPRVTARGGVTVRGHGWIVARLGTGAEVRARVPATVAYTFAGTGAVRVPRPDERVFVGPTTSEAGADAPAARLEVRGEALALDVVHGDVTLDLAGAFDVTLGARAELVAGDGVRFPGRGAGRSLRVDGTRVADAGPRPQAGGAAA